MPSKDSGNDTVKVIDEGFICPRTENSQVRTQVIEVGGERYISIGQWYKRRNDTEWKPGKAVTLPLSRFPKFTNKLASLAADNAEGSGG